MDSSGRHSSNQNWKNISFGRCKKIAKLCIEKKMTEKKSWCKPNIRKKRIKVLKWQNATLMENRHLNIWTLACLKFKCHLKLQKPTNILLMLFEMRLLTEMMLSLTRLSLVERPIQSVSLSPPHSDAMHSKWKPHRTNDCPKKNK